MDGYSRVAWGFGHLGKFVTFDGFVAFISPRPIGFQSRSLFHINMLELGGGWVRDDNITDFDWRI